MEIMVNLTTLEFSKPEISILDLSKNQKNFKERA